MGDLRRAREQHNPSGSDTDHKLPEDQGVSDRNARWGEQFIVGEKVIHLGRVGERERVRKDGNVLP